MATRAPLCRIPAWRPARSHCCRGDKDILVPSLLIVLLLVHRSKPALVLRMKPSQAANYDALLARGRSWAFSASVSVVHAPPLCYGLTVGLLRIRQHALQAFAEPLRQLSANDSDMGSGRCPPPRSPLHRNGPRNGLRRGLRTLKPRAASVSTVLSGRRERSRLSSEKSPR